MISLSWKIISEVSSYYRPRGPLRESRGINLLFFLESRHSRWRWVVNTTPRPPLPRERPGTHCTGNSLCMQDRSDQMLLKQLYTSALVHTVIEWHSLVAGYIQQGRNSIPGKVSCFSVSHTGFWGSPAFCSCN